MSESKVKPESKRPKRVVAPSPILPPAWDLADASAIQALHRGEATPDQQQRALKWIIESAAGTYDMPYRPGGDDGNRDTLFALGKQFVGQQVVKLLKLNLSALRRNDVSE